MIDPARIPRLGDYLEDARQLTHEAFVASHAPAFLLHHGPLGALQVAQADKGTLVGARPVSRERRFRPQSDFLVFPVRRARTAAPDDQAVTLGRGEVNDVVVPEATVSVYHAVIRRDADGAFYLQDCESKNGTLLNDQPVPTEAQGGWTRIDPGDRIHFGSLDMTFLDADQFRQLVVSLLTKDA